jgi:hypothetical protein
MSKRRKVEPAPTQLQAVLKILLEQYTAIDYLSLLLTCRQLHSFFIDLRVPLPLHDLLGAQLGTCQISLYQPSVRREYIRNRRRAKPGYALKYAVLHSQVELLRQLPFAADRALRRCINLVDYVHASGTFAMLEYFQFTIQQIQTILRRPRQTFRCLVPELLECSRATLDLLSDYELNCALLWLCRVPRPRVLPFVQDYIAKRKLYPTVAHYLSAPRLPEEWVQFISNFTSYAEEFAWMAEEFQTIWNAPYR